MPATETEGERPILRHPESVDPWNVHGVGWRLPVTTAARHLGVLSDGQLDKRHIRLSAVLSLVNMTDKANGRTVPTSSMRPNIQISHERNGRIKDWAAERGIDTDEAYRQIICAGLESLVADAPSVDWDRVRDACGFDDDELRAAQAVVDHCARNSGATKDQLLADVYPEHATGKSEDWWWRQIVTENGLERAGVLVGENARVMKTTTTRS